MTQVVYKLRGSEREYRTTREKFDKMRANHGGSVVLVREDREAEVKAAPPAPTTTVPAKARATAPKEVRKGPDVERKPKGRPRKVQDLHTDLERRADEEAEAARQQPAAEATNDSNNADNGEQA